MTRIPFDQLQAELKRVLLKLKFTEQKADAIATIYAENSRDGVYTHGLNRFPVFAQYVQEGHVQPDAEPSFISAFGGLEKWEGNLGPGMLNARFCMDRAIELAGKHGISCVAIRNTNHWMRGGTYGWQAAEAGCIGICFTNTIANLPPWGGTEPRLGNNPLVIALPRQNGHIVLDMAMSQFSFGKLLLTRSQGKTLPLPGGYDKEGDLTTNAADIIESGRMLPVGFWKGSGLSMVLDMMLTMLSDGNSTAEISKSPVERGVSQLFICIRPESGFASPQLIEEIISYSKTSSLLNADDPIRYPGEGTLKTREENMRLGVPVDEKIWEWVVSS